MSNGSGGNKGNGAYRPFPTLHGFVSGVKEYFTGRLPPKVPSYAPQREVKDAVTIGNDRGYGELHEMGKEHIRRMPPVAMQKAHEIHNDSLGYGVGVATAMAATAILLSRGRVAFPRFAPQIRAAKWANTLVGLNNLASLPNTLNERAKKSDPILHRAVSETLHTEAESIRNKS